MVFPSKEVSGVRRKWGIAAVSTVGAVTALVAIGEALVLIYHPHQCPSGWTQLDFDTPVGTASLIATVPLLIVSLLSALVAFGIGPGAIRRVLQRGAVSSLPIAIILMTASAGIALALCWGVISNLSSSTSGCLTF